MTEIETLNAIGYWLIKRCHEANAETMTFTLNGVHHLDEQLGDWEITVTQIKEAK